MDAALKLQVLILTMRTRAEFLNQLLSLLEPQIAALGLRKFDMVDIMIHHDDPARHYGGANSGVGDKREYMRQCSTGEYICWIDDDDLIAPDYVARILPLLDGVDHIGWEQAVYRDHERQKRDFHTITAGDWWDDATGFHRDISHLNPMRRDVALKFPLEGGYGEDRRWADRMRSANAVKTEHYIDAVMYHYLWRVRKDDAADWKDPWRLALIERLRPQ